MALKSLSKKVAKSKVAYITDYVASYMFSIVLKGSPKNMEYSFVLILFYDRPEDFLCVVCHRDCILGGIVTR